MKTLQLLMPLWQGGNNPDYMLGAQLLAFLAPKTENATYIEVPIDVYDGNPQKLENGMHGRNAVIKQLTMTSKIIEKASPDKIIVFGGDCLISQAPFAYLINKYQSKLGILWLDAHPDISNTQLHNNSHAMVLGNLLHIGDEELSNMVKTPITTNRVMYGGLQKPTQSEEMVLETLNIRESSSNTLATSSQEILEWIKEENLDYLAIHLDLDVLDPSMFHAIGSANPNIASTSSMGKMKLDEIARIFKDLKTVVTIVGISIAEHLPYDAINLKKLLEEIL